ncbi:mitochondrial 50S ribosomal protein L28-like protein [Fomitopsis serialis]|uniref:mitochondrial 50S ribosomal protein L28-like protein n=1 Tax=Fomitopsis serialis TaxID=139415 RepID=UPI002007746E|nr:mitochondrial 50S ribosomal protein L28-like protein [Neoantrodia serialis]XP_047896829.1 mitochondrial 50S ribosomal protein L28-like protein [Neoantrodia serialis]KAH9914117.1 mitochondrial 50S ribosomal protein L28-like protein [Neoantrodia serialis]KAH9931597.1 mitochondrial 50S ribosomal protein L28-like protein [Neoantrodia serialis]
MFASLPLLKDAISVPFKRSQLGLFHGKTKQYGNNVPHSLHKTRRSWLPNLHNKRFFSDALQQFVRVQVSTCALKTIKKYGGIDKYVLNTRHELLGWEGMRIRVMVREKLQASKQAEIQPAAAQAA